VAGQYRLATGAGDVVEVGSVLPTSLARRESAIRRLSGPRGERHPAVAGRLV
jgi:hypothetical protein